MPTSRSSLRSAKRHMRETNDQAECRRPVERLCWRVVKGDFPCYLLCVAPPLLRNASDPSWGVVNIHDVALTPLCLHERPGKTLHDARLDRSLRAAPRSQFAAEAPRGRPQKARWLAAYKGNTSRHGCSGGF